MRYKVHSEFCEMADTDEDEELYFGKSYIEILTLRYGKALEKFNFNREDETVEINTVEGLQEFSELLSKPVIVNYSWRRPNTLEIYDYWLE